MGKEGALAPDSDINNLPKIGLFLKIKSSIKFLDQNTGLPISRWGLEFLEFLLIAML